MTRQQYDQLAAAGFSPLPGRCVIHLDPLPERVGAIVIPEGARSHGERTTAYPGRVLAVRFTKEDLARFEAYYQRHNKTRHDTDFEEDYRVLVEIHLDEKAGEVIWARTGQVVAVIE